MEAKGAFRRKKERLLGTWQASLAAGACAGRLKWPQNAPGPQRQWLQSSAHIPSPTKGSRTSDWFSHSRESFRLEGSRGAGNGHLCPHPSTTQPPLPHGKPQNLGSI